MNWLQQKIEWIKMAAMQAEIDNDAFITTWNMTSGNFALLTQSYAYDALIDWGDGTTSTATIGSPTHTYVNSGQYQIKIYGSYPGLKINNDTTEKVKLIAINNWGNVDFKSFEYAFYGCSNLVSLPNGSITGAVNVTSFRTCFNRCTSLTSVPNEFFNYCINVTSYYYCFFYCENLALPTTIFNLTALQNKQPNMYQCFMVSSTAFSPTGTVQPIWSYISISTNNGCFYSCNLLSNYAQIPTAWKNY